MKSILVVLLLVSLGSLSAFHIAPPQARWRARRALKPAPALCASEQDEMAAAGQTCTRASLLPPPSIPVPAQLAALLAGYTAHVAWVSKMAFGLVLPISQRRIEFGVENALGVGILFLTAVRALLQHQHPPGSEDDKASSPRVPWGSLSGTRMELVQTAGTLVCVFLLSGYAFNAFGFMFYLLASLGLPVTEPQLRALQVLCSHLVWIIMAARVLGKRLSPFFPPPFGKGQWLSLRWRCDWLLWALGGYFASLFTYNAAEALNCAMMPLPQLAAATEADPGIGRAGDDTLVQQLLQPEGGDLIALGIGAVAPCLTAPIFEEVLYRGFLLPALRAFMPMSLALPLHSILFGLHHQSLSAVLPLSALGMLWGTIYLRSGNLLTVVLIHALWNTRIFIGSLVDIVLSP